MGSKRLPPRDPPPRLNADGSCREGCTCLLCQCAMPTTASRSSNYREGNAFNGNRQSPQRVNRNDRGNPFRGQ